jgi:phosphopantothenoylcysteine synthetase/decarboxylase
MTKPVIVCPAMNTHMWSHPLTAAHLDTLTRVLGYRVVPPKEQLLACGDVGMGALANLDDIVKAVVGACESAPAPAPAIAAEAPSSSASTSSAGAAAANPFDPFEGLPAPHADRLAIK